MAKRVAVQRFGSPMQNILQKGGGHILPGEANIRPEAKVGCVKPGGGRNADLGMKDALPGFEWLTSYDTAPNPGVDNGQAVYPHASKSQGESSNG
jgi:hypothetical protein